jgi:hypothetical protein
VQRNGEIFFVRRLVRRERDQRASTPLMKAATPAMNTSRSSHMQR